MGIPLVRSVVVACLLAPSVAFGPAWRPCKAAASRRHVISAKAESNGERGLANLVGVAVALSVVSGPLPATAKVPEPPSLVVAADSLENTLNDCESSHSR